MYPSDSEYWIGRDAARSDILAVVRTYISEQIAAGEASKSTTERTIYVICQEVAEKIRDRIEAL